MYTDELELVNKGKYYSVIYKPNGVVIGDLIPNEMGEYEYFTAGLGAMPLRIMAQVTELMRRV